MNDKIHQKQHTANIIESVSLLYWYVVYHSYLLYGKSCGHVGKYPPKILGLLEEMVLDDSTAMSE